MLQIAFPFTFDGQGRTASADNEAHVRQLIEQVLFTHVGERVNRPEFGSGLLQMVFEPNSDIVAAALQAHVHGELQRYLADVLTLHNLQVQSNDSQLVVEVAYSLKNSPEVRSEVFTRSATA